MKKTILTTTIAFLLGMGMGQNAHAESNYTYNGHTYFLVDATSWTEAQEKATNLGGNLVTINDQAENDWITLTFKDAKSLWIGYTDQETEGTFRWISGENSVYSNFSNGEPNDYHGNDNSQNYGEDYGHIILVDGKWNDMPNYLSNWEYTPAKGLVEVGDKKPKETVQISGQIKLGTQAGKDVALSGKGLTEECLTDVTGKFNCKITKDWTGFLTPESKGVSFSPPKISVTDAQTNLEVKTPLVGTTTDSFPLNGVMTSDWVKLKTDKATWQVETSTGASDDKTAYEGRFSFGSAKIGANQTAAIETTITTTQAVGYVEFARRVSSSENHGVLKFYIDGILQGQWSGNVDWGTESFAIINAANILDTSKYFAPKTHKLRWEYKKDAASTKGEDKAWIDAVNYPSSIKIATKNCEGITAGTVKLMTIKNPTCDQLQAYAVWLNVIRPKRMIDASVFSKVINDVDKTNELVQGYIDFSGKVYSYGKWLFGSKNLGEFLLDMNSKISNDGGGFALEDYPVTKEIWGLGNELVTQTLTALIESEGAALVAIKVAPVTYFPYSLEKMSGAIVNFVAAWSLDSITENVNSFNLADDFLDEYYKGGSNPAMLRAMAKKYGVEDTSLDTLVDALANKKGYYNTLYGWVAEDYHNENVVRGIKNVMAQNKAMLDYYQKSLVKKPLQTTQPLLP